MKWMLLNTWTRVVLHQPLIFRYKLRKYVHVEILRNFLPGVILSSTHL